MATRLRSLPWCATARDCAPALNLSPSSHRCARPSPASADNFTRRPCSEGRIQSHSHLVTSFPMERRRGADALRRIFALTGDHWYAARKLPTGPTATPRIAEFNRHSGGTPFAHQKYSTGHALLRIEVTVFFPAHSFLLPTSAKSTQYNRPVPRYRKDTEQHEFRHFDTIGNLAKFVPCFFPDSLTHTCSLPSRARSMPYNFLALFSRRAPHPALQSPCFDGRRRNGI